MGLIVAFVLTAATTPAWAGLARRLGVVDRPGPLKVQQQPVAYLGGIAVLTGFAGPVLVARPALAVPLLLATLLGLADDVAQLPVAVRLGVETAIGVLVPVTLDVPWPLVPLVTLGVIALINAVNLLDGLDGLAAGVALASATGFAVVLDGDQRTLALGLAGALAGFLLWNRPPASVYLGDAGSYLLGTVLASLGAAPLGSEEPGSVVAAGALLVGVPLGDMTVAVLRRWRAGRPLWLGDRGHVYDQLVARGWTVGRTVLACVIAQAGLAVLAVGVASLSTAVATAVVAITVGVVAVWAVLTFTSPATWREPPGESAQ